MIRSRETAVCPHYQLFPIDISAVEKDHDFLDKDSIQSLFRRLNTLNKCATMKIDAPPRKAADESDDEDQCAISDKWKYQRSSRRWSRKDLELLPIGLDNDPCGEKGRLRSSSSHDSVLTDNEENVSHQESDSPVLQTKTPHNGIELRFKDLSVERPPASVTSGHVSDSDNSSAPSPGPLSPSIRRAASEKFKGAKNFLRRMESLKSRKQRGRVLKDSGGRVEISDPVLVDTDEVQRRMTELGCVDLSPTSPTATDPLQPSPQMARLQQQTRQLELQTLAATTASDTDSAPSPALPKRSASLTHNTSLHAPPTQHSGPVRHNHSSSDLGQLYNVGPDHKPGSFPKLMANGCIETSDGGLINCRTGSFNMGADSHHYRETILRRARGASEEPPVSTKPSALPTSTPAPVLAPAPPPSTAGPPAMEHRVSVYDNVAEGGDLVGVNPQEELDRILQELYQNISGLDETLEMASAGTQHSHTGASAPTFPSSSASTQSHRAETVTSGGSNLMKHTAHTGGTQPSSLPASFGLKTSTAASSRPDHIPHQRTQPHSEHWSHDMVRTSIKRTNIELDLDPDLFRETTQSGSVSNQELSDPGTPGSREEEGPEHADNRERRDSGVGSSLTRAPSEHRRQRIRWHSFIKSHRPSLTSRSLQLGALSAGHLMVLRKLSLLKVTALMEKYSPSNRSGWNWIMPKFMKRWKAPDYSGRRVFGVPLLVVLQRTGQPLPQCVLRAMRCLRRTALDAVGIFRKSGVRSRIQKLRNQIEADPESVDFESLQSYDVADLLKQYFRELPECLLTNKLSDTFISIFTHMPADVRLEALQAAVMLLPDENRQVLQSLLFFLSDMASQAHVNQMNASNLAVCFAPSLFNMGGGLRGGGSNNPAASPKRNRKQAGTGVPDHKELLDQKAAHQCLTLMIAECKQLFQVAEDMLSKCRLSYIELGDPVPLEQLGGRGQDQTTAPVDHAHSQMDSAIQGLLKEARDRWKGWVGVGSLLPLPPASGVEVAYKKVGDGHPLRLWKACIEVEAPPVELLNRVLRERHLWDEDLLQWRVVDKLAPDLEVFQYQLSSMAPHPTQDVCELRSWRTGLGKGACVLVSTSVEHPGATQLGGVRAVVLASRYLIEPCGAGKSRLTHVCRMDHRGQTAEWYNRCFGHLCANQLIRIRDSFTQAMAGNDGPETKV